MIKLITIITYRANESTYLYYQYAISNTDKNNLILYKQLSLHNYENHTLIEEKLAVVSNKKKLKKWQNIE